MSGTGTITIIVFSLVVFSFISRIGGQVCIQGNVRLVDGSVANEGRVEICNSGTWGTVCDDGWSTNDAQVVCRQLGYLTTNSVAFSDAYFGEGTGSIWLDEVFCFGTESTLLSCSHDGLGIHDCVHSEDAGVYCEVSCTYGDVRLADGSDSSEGRVEICINDEWGTVCDDFWDNDDADVVCRQVGDYSSGTALSSAHFGQGTGEIWLDNVACTGSESELLDCSHNGIGVENCVHSEDASVRCNEPLSAGAIAGIVLGSIFGFLGCVVCPIFICVAIGCYSSKKSKRRIVTQPQVTTVGTTITEHSVPLQPYPSAYPTGTATSYPQQNPAYPYPVQSVPYPVQSAPYPTVEGTYPQPYPPPQGSQLHTEAPPTYDDLAKTSIPVYY